MFLKIFEKVKIIHDPAEFELMTKSNALIHCAMLFM